MFNLGPNQKSRLLTQLAATLLVSSLFMVLGFTAVWALRPEKPRPIPSENMEIVSDIRVERDGTLSIVEKIRAKVEGRLISKGFCRKFKESYLDANKNPHPVTYELLWKEELGKVSYPGSSTSERNVAQVCFGLPKDGAETLPHGYYDVALQYSVSNLLNTTENGESKFLLVSAGPFDTLPILKYAGQITLPVDAASKAVLKGSIRSLRVSKADPPKKSDNNLLSFSVAETTSDEVTYNFRTNRSLRPGEFVLVQGRFPSSNFSAK